MNTTTNKNAYKKGIKDGIPIALGYFVVSFTLGIAARNIGLNALQSAVISFTNNASAGEFAAFEVIKANAPYTEMLITMLIVNLRYLLMSCALSQRIDTSFPFYHRFFVAYDVTDEIFGISVAYPGKLNPFYSYGAMTVALPGWAVGTALGVICGNIMPGRLLSAMNVALYGMFIAIVIPPSKHNRVIAALVTISMVSSAIFTYAPYVKNISPGFRIIILTIIIAGIAAVLFPIKEDDEKEKFDEK